MDSVDSLDWIWKDFSSFNPSGAAGEFDDDDDDVCDVYGTDDVNSDLSSGLSDISCSFLIGDKKTVQELNGIVDDIIEKNYGRGDGGLDDNADEIDELFEGDDYYDEHQTAANASFYIDALDAAKKLLPKVNLVWTDTLYRCIVNEENVPESYTKTTNIEKIILFYAENFIEQFRIKYPNRRQMFLVHENECGIQKCVCTTIKPSRLVYDDLNDMLSYSEFVAKHITYIKLEDPTIVPKKLASPTTTLQMQIANCFELATLLVSFLIGCGYDAFVVQGYATETVCNNDLRIVKLDLPNIITDEQRVESKNIDVTDDDYDDVIEPMITLDSEYVRFLIEEEKNKNLVENDVNENDFNYSIDPLSGRRVHSWVVIIPSEIKDEINTTKNPYFIEPCTGEIKNISDENYIGIEAIWNHTNYWVNLQSLNGGCAKYDFTLMNVEFWEHFLPEETQNLPTDINNEKNPKRLVMPNSWVNVLEIPRNRYLMLYPSGKKIVQYMNAIKESYADYIVPDGLIERITYFAEPDYTRKIFVKEIYKHRIDMLISVEIRYTNKYIETTEYFSSGREDCLKVHKFRGECNNMHTKRWATFYNLRLDSMSELEVDENSFVASYKDRSDLLFWRLCIFKQFDKNDKKILNVKRKPKNIIDKYLRDESKHKDFDIATIRFNILNGNIFVFYQYGEGQITQSSRIFTKPLVTNKDEFDPDSVVEDIVYPYEGYLKPHEAYTLLQDMLEVENEALRDVSKLENDFLKLLETRNREQSEFKLKIDTLDWDRNYRIRKYLQNLKDKKLLIAQRDKASQIDHALPYFETVKKPFMYDNILKVRDKIIRDFRQNTKCLFLKTRTLFMKKQSELQSLTAALDVDDFKELNLKNQMIMLCSSLKIELDVLLLKMERYNETRIKRYNNLVSYLNSNDDFKMLSPLPLYFDQA